MAGSEDMGVAASQDRFTTLPDCEIARFWGEVHSSVLCPLNDIVALKLPEESVTKPVSYSLLLDVGVYFT